MIKKDAITRKEILEERLIIGDIVLRPIEDGVKNGN